MSALEIPPPRTAQLLDELLDRERAAAFLRISTDTLDRRVRERRIATYRIGGRIRFAPKDLDAFVRASRVEARP